MGEIRKGVPKSGPQEFLLGHCPGAVGEKEAVQEWLCPGVPHPRIRRCKGTGQKAVSCGILGRLPSHGAAGTIQPTAGGASADPLPHQHNWAMTQPSYF